MGFWFDHLSIRTRILLLVLISQLPVAGLLVWLLAADVFVQHPAAWHRAAAFGLADLLLTLALAWRLNKSIARPMAQLARVAAGVAAGNLTVRAQVGGASETRAVALQFNRMLDARDFSEAALRRSERALRRSEALLRGIFNSANDAILTSDQQQLIVMANPAAALMFQYPVDNLPGMPLDRLIPARFREQHRHDVQAFGRTQVAARHMGGTADVQGLRADGQEFPVDAAISHLSVEGQTLYTVILRDTTQRRLAEAALAASHADLQRLYTLQDKIQEDERKRIARELHDDLQQTLAAIRIDLGTLRDRLQDRLQDRPLSDPGPVNQLLTEIDQLASGAIVSTRRIVNDLRPQMLEELGLAPSLEMLAKQFSQRANIPCSFETQGDPFEEVLESPAVTTCLYRVTQESLNNVAKHARASSASIRLAHTDAGHILLRVSDNGSGMSPAERHKPASFGLLGMAERVRALGGALRIYSEPGAGTTVEVLVPASHPALPTAGAEAPTPAQPTARAQPAPPLARAPHPPALQLQALVDALAGNVAVLDRQGRIHCVNQAWRDFAEHNGDAHTRASGPGVNYLAVCRRSALHDPFALHVLNGLSAVLNGSQAAFTGEYPCHSAQEQRWFRMHAAPVGDDRVLVTHFNLSTWVEPAAGPAVAV